MEIFDYCKNCKKETLQYYDEEKKIVECLLCKDKENTRGRKVYPVWGEPAD